MEPTEFFRERNQYINEYVRFADGKAGAVLGLATLIVGALGLLTQDLLKAFAVPAPWWLSVSKRAFVWTGGSLLFLAALSSAAVAYYCLTALRPRLPAAQDSLASFPVLAKQDARKIKEILERVKTPEDVAEHYALHSIEISALAMEKFKAIGSSIKWLVFLLADSLVFLVFYIVTRGIFPSSSG